MRRAEPTFEGWRAKARALLTAEVAPDAVVWSEQQGRAPFSGRPLDEPENTTRPPFSVPRRFVALAELVACHRATDRWPLLYRVLWRLAHENARLLNDGADRDVSMLVKMADEVRQDVERMQRFVRFRAIGDQHQEYFIGWHRAEHRIAPLVAPFFTKRYPNIRWTLFTPQSTIHWDGHALSFGEDCRRRTRTRAPKSCGETIVSVPGVLKAKPRDLRENSKDRKITDREPCRSAGGLRALRVSLVSALFRVPRPPR